MKGTPGLLSRLLEIPSERNARAPAGSYDYSWAFARAERALNSWFVGECPDERASERLAELEGLSEGEQIRRVGADSYFADPELIHCLIERSHDARYRSPRKALHHARLAQIAAEACTPEKAEGEAQLADLRAWAWGQYGNALRICGRTREAEEALATARRHREAGTCDPKLHAWLLTKTIPLTYLQGRFEAAIQMCEAAGAIYLELRETQCFASTLVQKAIATLHSSEPKGAIDILHQAIPLIDGEKDPYLLLIAHHNLARCYIDFDRPEEALAQHYAARSFYQECKDPLILLRATWQEGVLLRDLGHLHNAEITLLRARQGYLEQGLAYEVALVGLELVELYLKLGKTAELRRMIAEAVPIFRATQANLEVFASLLVQQTIPPGARQAVDD